MEKIRMTEKAYTAITNLKRLGTARFALRSLMSVGVIDENELKKIVSQLSRWEDGLFDVIYAPPEERKGE